jgi:23S rRNA pseudouridine2605 synthase
MNDGQTIRIDKFLSGNGFVSRRGVKQFLKTESVTVNGERVRESGTRISPEDDVRVNGAKIKQKGFVYFILNKPKGIISTASDEFDRKNVTDLIDTDERIYPVGRLDKDTHGLILLTNDGQLTHKLTHPKFHVTKTYRLVLSGHPTEAKLDKLRNGIILTDGITLPAKVKVVKQTESQTIVEMEIFEGRYRQIRRMCDAIFLKLVDLERIKFGEIKIGDLREGKYRKLMSYEVSGLIDLFGDS